MKGEEDSKSLLRDDITPYSEECENMNERHSNWCAGCRHAEFL